MSTTQVSSYPSTLKQGDYHPPLPGDYRTPCPVVNTLANHGYLPRDGRNVTAEHFKTGLSAIGLAWDLSKLLVDGTFVEHKPEDESAPNTDPNSTVPETQLIHGGGPSSGLRDPGQVNDQGVPVINLNQVGRHNAVEHDVSMSRLDMAQGDNTTKQPDLIAKMLASSADGEVITTTDFGKIRRDRYEQQVRDNPQLQFGKTEQFVVTSELALIQGVFGQGMFWHIPLKYIKSLFEEERLPHDEGWKKRWTPYTLLEFAGLQNNAQRYCSVPLPVEQKK